MEDKTTQKEVIGDEFFADAKTLDANLRLLVDIANKANKDEKIGLPIALTVGGLIVSGNLIGIQNYYEDLVNQLNEAQAINGEESPSNYDALNPWAKNPDLPVADYPVSIHLKDAVIIQGFTKYKVGLWRGKIGAVDGYSVGISFPED